LCLSSYGVLINKEEKAMLKATAIILSGGKNSRMGCNKAFLEIDGQKIIEKIIQELYGVFDQVIIVSNEPIAYSYLDVEVIPDLIPGCGPLSGMHAGLAKARNYYSLVVACDMPFVDSRLAGYLVQEAPGFDVVVPQVNQLLQPLFAVYSQNCLTEIKKCIERRVFSISAFYHRVRVKYIPQKIIAELVNPYRVFLNVNTPYDLEIVHRLIAGGSIFSNSPTLEYCFRYSKF